MLIELDYPEARPVQLDAARTLLLIVDMENENAHPAGALFIGEPVRKIIPKIAGLRERVRAAGGRVAHTQSVRSPDALEFTVFNNVVRKLEGSWGAELIDELKPAPDEPLIVKRTHDCFYRTGMDELLSRMGLRPGEGQVVVTGISTRNCVQSAVMGFSVRDYRVYVPMDCTAQKDEKEVLQAFSLFTSFGYRHNVTMTRSDLISVRPLSTGGAG
ncbi:MAG TPA: isochorismatase family cysteine hydrolase [candidate division Zixibacteria bacterium]|nr:isochorismatase family cysteine hydrolase [candidate division Zixibacteria bacterium]